MERAVFRQGAGRNSGLTLMEEELDSRVDILGVPVSATDPDNAVRRLLADVRSRRRTYVCVCSVHGIMECRRSAELTRIFLAAGMVAPDGMPLVWVARSRGFRTVGRVYGPDLMLNLMRAGISSGLRHFLFGAGPGVAETAARTLGERFPGLRVVGTESPLFGAAEDLADDETARTINGTGADVVWVGISTPKQERWMAAMRDRLEAPLLIGVGAAFDFHAGRVRQAPAWMQRSGLEWSFRLLMEPRRLWRRYLVNNSWFVWSLVVRRLRRRA